MTPVCLRAQHITQSLQGSMTFFARYLAFVPVAFLTACALQQPLPPETPPATADIPDEVELVEVPAPAAAIPEPAPPPPSEQQIAMLQMSVDQQNRLYRVAAPLLINNVELCPRHARDLVGLTARTRHAYTRGYAATARAALGLGERLRVMGVLPGSGAETAGMRKGDVLLGVEDKALPYGPNADRDAPLLIGSEIQGRANLNLMVLRDGKRMKIDVPLTRACAFAVELGNTDLVNSYADGHRVMVTRGMLGFVRSDEELAYVIAKEIAHNVLARSPRADMGAVIDSLRVPDPRMGGLDKLAGIEPYTPVLDATADKLSLYLLVRAGYSIDNALDFWKRLASDYPADKLNAHTALHPSTKYRFSVMNEITKVIRTKQKRNLPLVP